MLQDAPSEGSAHHLPTTADRDRITELAMQFQPALRRYFLRRRLNRDDAEDAVQEVFVRLSRRAGLAMIDNIEGYLFETAASVAIDHQRRGRVRSYDRHDSYDDERHGLPDFASDRVLQGRQELQVVLAALRELPERSRNVFILARLEQMRHAEIARRLGISVSTVEKHVVRALAHLALRLGEAR